MPSFFQTAAETCFSSGSRYERANQSPRHRINIPILAGILGQNPDRMLAVTDRKKPCPIIRIVPEFGRYP
jgi:hypothetical protein